MKFDRVICVLMSMILFMPILMSGCKEKIERHKKAQPQYDIEKVSRNIERITQENVESEEGAVVNDRGTRAHPILNLPEALQEAETVGLGAAPRCVLSQFPAESGRDVIRVTITSRGGTKAQQEETEEKIFNILSLHAPHPWELSRGRAADGQEKSWGRLNVDLKHQTLRMRRTSKTAPLRAEINYSLSMSMTTPKNMKSSWGEWKYSYRDEITVGSEGSANALFWKNVVERLPTLTVIEPEETGLWLQAQGLSRHVLDDTLSEMRVSEHVYYPDGCVLSTEPGRASELRQIQTPYSPPQKIDIPGIMSMSCQKDATFIVSAETPLRMALYYEPKRGVHAWKSQLTFADSIRPGDLLLHVDDDLICLVTGLEAQQNRGVEVQCLERKTGLMRWQTKRLSGALRGVAFDDRQVVIANDQALVSISRDGVIRKALRLETSSRLRSRLSCQLQNRLIMMTGPGQFAAWNLDTDEFDWQAGVLESEFVHCSQQNTFIFSEVGGYLLAYDVEKNEPLWKYQTTALPKDAFSYGGNVYFLLEQAILVLDRVTGKRKAQIPLAWPANRFIAIGSRLYLDTKEAVYTWR